MIGANSSDAVTARSYTRQRCPQLWAAFDETLQKIGPRIVPTCRRLTFGREALRFARQNPLYMWNTVQINQIADARRTVPNETVQEFRMLAAAISDVTELGARREPCTFDMLRPETRALLKL